MNKIGSVAVATVFGIGLVSSAQAHVFVGMGVGMPVVPVYAPPVVAVAPFAPAVPLAPVAPVPVYAPPVAYYAPSVAVGYWGGHPGWGYRHYAAGYWR
ncbi:hypothetical protein [Caballeronia sp. J97]|uniref:hypothetical protein n=1 Tax=Caballeronia sp. J97 TaxID=2805429 RepID=UPI002AB23501|nr:hypothetical protein [Caballeronia sp. J97]